MQDSSRLRARLFELLILPAIPIAIAPTGCKKTRVADDEDTTTGSSRHGRAAEGGTTTMSTESPRDFRTPSCPSGVWCTTAANAARVAAPDAGVETACTRALAWSSGGDSGVDDLPAPFGQGTLDPAATKSERAKKAGACCYAWVMPCPGGRPLRADGERVDTIAALGRARGWCNDAGSASDEALSPARRNALAAAWLADALYEHASVASFARAALELMAVGAPAELVAAAQRASLDEIEHARDCFALASRFAGRALAPGPLASPACRPATIARVAVDTFLEGCVGETIAALAAERAGAGCADAGARAVLARIAEDEAAHAALAWRTVAWAIEDGGAEICEALEKAARTARSCDVSAAPEGGDDAVLARFGRLGPAARRRAAADAWSDVIEPTLSALRGQSAARGARDAEPHPCRVVPGSHRPMATLEG